MKETQSLRDLKDKHTFGFAHTVLHHQSTSVHLGFYDVVLQFTPTFSQPALSSSSSGSDVLYFPKWLFDNLQWRMLTCCLQLCGSGFSTIGASIPVSVYTSKLEFLNVPCPLAVLHYSLLLLTSQEILISLCLLILKVWQQYLTLTVDI